MRLFKALIAIFIISQIWSCDDTQNTKTTSNIEFQEFDQFFQNIENFSGNILVAVEGETIYSKSIGMPIENYL